MLRESIRKIRAEPGPDAWTFALFRIEAIAREARDANDWEFARYAAEQMREHDAFYGGTHYALGLIAEHAGERGQARNEYGQAIRLWKRADEGLRDAADARRRLSILLR